MNNLIGNDDTIGFVFNDAGAANLLFHWIKAVNINGIACVDGPAKKIWGNLFPGVKTHTLDEVIKTSSIILAGSGWSSDLEYMAIKRSNSLGKKNISVVDHWVNYKERFLRSGIQCLPSEIWVFDEYAVEIACKQFPGIEVVKKQNYYLSQLSDAVRKYEVNRTHDELNVLYVLEPVRNRWPGSNSKIEEFQAIDFFLRNIKKLTSVKKVNIILRPHPSENYAKYSPYQSQNDSLNIQIDSNDSLECQIAWSDWVVGCESYAMVVGLALGRKVISTIPPNGTICRLPHKEILHLRNIV